MTSLMLWKRFINLVDEVIAVLAIKVSVIKAAVHITRTRIIRQN